LVEPTHVKLRDYEEMGFGLRPNIPNAEELLVLMDSGGGQVPLRDSAKKTF
jgi:hypothetical protein